MSNQPQAHVAATCPKCHRALQKVAQGPDSMLNSEQFDAVRAGDWFCELCPKSPESGRYTYFWNRDLPATPSVSQAHVADERAAFEAAFKPNSPDGNYWMRRTARGSYSNPAMQSAWQGWQARAAIPAGANVADVLASLKRYAEPEAYPVGGYAAMTENPIGDYLRADDVEAAFARIAAGAPAETPKPPIGTPEGMRAYGKVYSKGYAAGKKAALAAQPAPAPATDARDAEILDFIEKEAIKGGTYRGITSANIVVNEGEWHELGLRAAIRAAMARAAMLSANSPREAG